MTMRTYCSVWVREFVLPVKLDKANPGNVVIETMTPIIESDALG